jgi:hypothetical protein
MATNVAYIGRIGKEKEKSELKPLALQLTFSLFFVSSPICRMYVLYRQAIILVLPVFSTIEKKVEKKVSPPISPFLGGKRLNLVFSPFLDPLPVYEFL